MMFSEPSQCYKRIQDMELSGDIEQKEILNKTKLAPLVIIQQIMDYWPEYQKETHTWENAILLQRLDWIDLLHYFSIPWNLSIHVMELAASCEKLKVVKHLIKMKLISYKAIEYTDDIDTLQYLLNEKICNPGSIEKVIIKAIKNSNYEIIELMYEYSNYIKFRSYRILIECVNAEHYEMLEFISGLLKETQSDKDKIRAKNEFKELF